MKFIAPIAALLMTMMLSISCDGGLVGMGGGRQPEDKRIQAIESESERKDKEVKPVSTEVTSAIASRQMGATNVIPPSSTPVISTNVTAVIAASGAADKTVSNLEPIPTPTRTPTPFTLDDWFEKVCLDAGGAHPVSCEWFIHHYEIQSEYDAFGHQSIISLFGRPLAKQTGSQANKIELRFYEEKFLQDALNAADTQWTHVMEEMVYSYPHFHSMGNKSVWYPSESYYSRMPSELSIYMPLDALDGYLGVLNYANTEVSKNASQFIKTYGIWDYKKQMNKTEAVILGKVEGNRLLKFSLIPHAEDKRFTLHVIGGPVNVGRPEQFLPPKED